MTTIKNNQIFADSSAKVAVTVIAGVILTFITLAITANTNKVDKETFQEKCKENDRRFERLEKQNKDRELENKEIIDMLHKLDIQLTEVKVNTNRLLEKEKNNPQ